MKKVFNIILSVALVLTMCSTYCFADTTGGLETITVDKTAQVTGTAAKPSAIDCVASGGAFTVKIDANDLVEIASLRTFGNGDILINMSTTSTSFTPKHYDIVKKTLVSDTNLDGTTVSALIYELKFNFTNATNGAIDTKSLKTVTFKVKAGQDYKVFEKKEILDNRGNVTGKYTYEPVNSTQTVIAKTEEDLVTFEATSGVFVLGIQKYFDSLNALSGDEAIQALKTEKESLIAEKLTLEKQIEEQKASLEAKDANYATLVQALKKAAAPTVKAVQVGKTVKVSVVAVPNVEVKSYTVYRSTSKTGTYVKMFTITNGKTVYKNSAVKKGKTYFYKVKTNFYYDNKVLTSYYSNRVSKTVK